MYKKLIFMALIISGCNSGYNPLQSTEPFFNWDNIIQGPLIKSNKATDWALDGNGFFVLTDSSNKQTLYTRDGSFNVDEKGSLINKHGFLLEPAVTVGKDQSFSYISDSGRIYFREGDTKVLSNISQISIAVFPNPDSLKPIEGKENIFIESVASGKPVVTFPKQSGAGFVIGGTLEDLRGKKISIPNPGCNKEKSNLLKLSEDKTPNVIKTGRTLDLAIEGKGFFQVFDPLSGMNYYTRVGAFQYDNYSYTKGFPLSEGGPEKDITEGNLIATPHGYPVDDQLQLEQGETVTRIDQKGMVYTKTKNSEKEVKKGKVKIVTFENPEGLQPLGFTRGSLYISTEASGPPIHSTPGENNVGTIISGIVEKCGEDIIARP